VEKILGPFNGFYVAVYVRDLGNLGTSFLGHYKICQKPPVDFFSADFVRSKCVEGISASADEAQEIASQLAKLQIGNFRRRLGAARTGPASVAPLDSQQPLDSQTLLDSVPPQEHERSRSYDPTIPCPL
jgi:hypothetical protein